MKKRLIAGATLVLAALTGCTVSLGGAEPELNESTVSLGGAESELDETALFRIVWQDMPRSERMEMCQGLETLGALGDEIVLENIRDTSFDPELFLENLHDACANGGW